MYIDCGRNNINYDNNIKDVIKRKASAKHHSFIQSCMLSYPTIQMAEVKGKLYLRTHLRNSTKRSFKRSLTIAEMFPSYFCYPGFGHKVKF